MVVGRGMVHWVFYHLHLHSTKSGKPGGNGKVRRFDGCGRILFIKVLIPTCVMAGRG